MKWNKPIFTLRYYSKKGKSKSICIHVGRLMNIEMNYIKAGLNVTQVVETRAVSFCLVYTILKLYLRNGILPLQYY